MICTERWFSYYKLCILHIPISYFTVCFQYNGLSMQEILNTFQGILSKIWTKWRKKHVELSNVILAQLCNHPDVSRINNEVVWFHGAKHFYILLLGTNEKTWWNRWSCKYSNLSYWSNSISSIFCHEDWSQAWCNYYKKVPTQ